MLEKYARRSSSTCYLSDIDAACRLLGAEDLGTAVAVPYTAAAVTATAGATPNTAAAVHRVRATPAALHAAAAAPPAPPAPAKSGGDTFTCIPRCLHVQGVQGADAAGKGHTISQQELMDELQLRVLER